MSILAASANITTASVFSEVQTLKRKRYFEVHNSCYSTAILAYVGRNVNLDSQLTGSLAETIVNNIRKISRPNLAIVANTEANLSRIAIFPPSEPPTGEILFQGKTLNGVRLSASNSNILSFTITGVKISELQIIFTLSDLSGKGFCRKTLLGSPGGIYIDTTVDNIDRSKTFIGLIPLYSQDFSGITAKEQEMHYSLEMESEITSRKYLIETGTTIIYKL